MKKKILNLILLFISAVCFAMDSKLIYNMGYFCDEHNFSPDVIYGGEFYLLLSWAEWALLAIICLILLIGFIISLFKKHKRF